MNISDNAEEKKDFLSSSGIVKNYSLLQDIGVFRHIEFLDQEIKNYKTLFSGVLDIVNCTTINEIMDSAVRQISDHFLPSIIVFIWKPMQNREDITVKCYKNYKLVNLKLSVDSINAFEPFFREHPVPVNYRLFSSEMGSCGSARAFDDIKPELIIPILGPSGLNGLVLMGAKILEDEYTPTEYTHIKNLMSFVSKAIQNNLHYERTLRDVKTGLYNYGLFMTRLNEEIARSKRNQSKASVIMMDVDKFKEYNDTYGHIAGDRVLESLAITIKQGVRTEDVPSRFGGEEFTVLLPDTDSDSAWLVAERLRNMVAAMTVPWTPPLPKVTISLGVFTFGMGKNYSSEEIISRVDEALYMSKKRGRNCTTIWGAGLYDKIERKKQASKTKRGL